MTLDFLSLVQTRKENLLPAAAEKRANTIFWMPITGKAIGETAQANMLCMNPQHENVAFLMY